MCNESVISGWTYNDIYDIKKTVKKISSKGVDVSIDLIEFCEHCSNQKIEYPEIIFKIRFKDDEGFHVVKSNIPSYYSILLAFIENQETWTDEYNNTEAIKKRYEIIEKMTGLKYEN